MIFLISPWLHELYLNATKEKQDLFLESLIRQNNERR